MLFDFSGNRKYLTTAEWQSFLNAADDFEPLTRSFCAVVAHTGARISEVRALTANSIDTASGTIIFECLKRRRRGIFRAVPVPGSLIELLEDVHRISARRADSILCKHRLWPWCRTTAWSRVKEVCAKAGVPEYIAMPKSFRHSFGVRGAAQAGVPLGTMRKWLGHSRLETTAIYTDAMGPEERLLAERMWSVSATS